MQTLIGMPGALCVLQAEQGLVLTLQTDCSYGRQGHGGGNPNRARVEFLASDNEAGNSPAFLTCAVTGITSGRELAVLRLGPLLLWQGSLQAAAPRS